MVSYTETITGWIHEGEPETVSLYYETMQNGLNNKMYYATNMIGQMGWSYYDILLYFCFSFVVALVAGSLFAPIVYFSTWIFKRVTNFLTSPNLW